MGKGDKKRYAIIGTGAVGGFCAVKLHQAGFDVHCLLNRDYDVVKAHGLTIVAGNERVTEFINAYKDISQMPPCDVMIIATKSTSNKMLKGMLAEWPHENTIVAVLQNGIGVEEEVASFIEPHRIVGGSTVLKVTKIAPGVVQDFGSYGFEWAQYFPDDTERGISDAAQGIADDFLKAGLKSAVADHLPTIKWKKLAINIPISGLSVLLDAATNELVENPASFALLKMLTKEVIETAKQCGAYIPDDFYASRLVFLESLRNMQRNYFSMKDDYNAKRPMELHVIYENAINIAKKHGLSMPLTEMLFLQLSCLNDPLPLRI